MKKILISLATVMLVISCTTSRVNIAREEAMEINKKIVLEKFNKVVDEDQLGYYIGDNIFRYFNLIDDMIYEIKLDADGKLIYTKKYKSYTGK